MATNLPTFSIMGPQSRYVIVKNVSILKIMNIRFMMLSIGRGRELLKKKSAEVEDLGLQISVII